MNGSSANGGCPSPCVGVVSGITTCDCGAHSTLGDEAITGVLIDGVIPTIDTSERNTAGEWAAPLFTVRGSTDTVTLGFRFPASVVLHEVKLYLFHCPAWGIGAERIVIHNGASFSNSIGSVILTSDPQNCISLTGVAIPLQTTRNTASYFIEFSNPSGDLIEWVHIAEVRFSDQPNTIATTTTPLISCRAHSDSGGSPVAASCVWYAAPSVCPESQGIHYGRERRGEQFHAV